MKPLVAFAAVAAAVAVVLAPAAATVARADAPGETAPRRATHHKKMSTAFLLTLAATSAPLAISAFGEGCASDACGATFGTIGMAGMVLGPSAGHWYAGEGVTSGLLLRGTAVTAMITLALRDPHLEQPVGTIGGLLLAVGVWETGVIWDLVTLPRAVRRARTREVLVAPLVGGDTTGLALSGRW